jgi:hypothetical protein
MSRPWIKRAELFNQDIYLLVCNFGGSLGQILQILGCVELKRSWDVLSLNVGTWDISY